MKTGTRNIALPLVFLSGIVTSLITLAIVYGIMIFLNFNLLGFYIWIFPAGSLAAGLAAGSGYYASSRLLNAKTNSAFTALSALAAILAYTAAYYLLFVVVQESTSLSAFVGYMFANASNSSLTIGKSTRSTIDNIGAFGYVLLALEYAGFVLGSVMPVTYGKSKLYCPDCKLFYKKGAVFACSPALGNGDIANPESAESKALIEKNNGILRLENEKIRTAIKGKSFEEITAYLGQACAQGVTRNAFYLTFSVQKCPKCGNHVISSTLNSHVNKDGGMVTEELGVLSSAPEAS